jgi:mannose-6-phosphate isomerase-like protein (cupin superfamily)
MTHVVGRPGQPKQITCGIMRELTKTDKLDISHVTITKSTKKHYHKKLTEFYYVLKGKLDVETDGIVEHLEPGQIIMISPGTEHEAHGNAEVLVICTPPWAEEDEVLV